MDPAILGRLNFEPQPRQKKIILPSRYIAWKKVNMESQTIPKV